MYLTTPNRIDAPKPTTYVVPVVDRYRNLRGLAALGCDECGGVCGGKGMGDVASSAVSSGIGAGVQLAVSGVQMWLNSIQLSHIADTATTQIVNGLEPLLRANVAAFQAGPQTQCSQQIALAAFDQAWQWLSSSAGCGNGSYGSAGNACISDRQRGGKWDWFSYYRDPIATANVTPGTACPGTTVSGSGIQTDVTNDDIDLLGQSGDQYFALLQASGQANDGVIPSSATATTTSGGTVTTSSTGTSIIGLSTPVLGTLTVEQLLIPAGLLVAALVLMK